MAYDFNKLETKASLLKSAGRHGDALRIYLFMADGDSRSMPAKLSGDRFDNALLKLRVRTTEVH